MSRAPYEPARSSLRRGQDHAVASTSVILSLLNALVAYIACFIANQALHLIVSDWVVPFIFFTSLETLHAQKIEKRILKNYGHSTLFRAAEIIVLALLLRMLLLLIGGSASRLALFLNQLDTPFAAFFTGEYTTALILLGLLWGFSLLNLRDMQTLFNLDERISWDQIGKEQTDLIKTRQGFMQRFLFLGLALLTGMFFSVTTWGGGRLSDIELHGTPPVLIIVILLYFYLVLLLMSQTQLARLRTRWWLNQSTVHPLLGKRWLQVSLLFFAALSLLVLLLPTGFGEDLLEILQVLLMYLALLGQALLALLIIPLAFLFPWLNVQTSGTESVEEAPIAPTPTPEVLPDRQPPAWLGQAGDILFWVILALALGFAVFQYLQQDRSLLQYLRTLIHAVSRWLTTLWQRLTGKWENLQAEIRRRTRQRTRGSQRLRDLNDTAAEKRPRITDQPRLWMFALYQSLLEWGTAHGITRKPYQTPLTYEAQLETHLHTGEETASRHDMASIHALTENFDEARYSLHAIPEDRVAELAREWEKTQKGKPPASNGSGT